MEESLDRVEDSGGVSRRKMLKRIGVATAAAWTAPVLSSFRAPAFAQREQCVCEGDPCDCQTPCNDQGCFCNQNVDGQNTYCTVPTDCSNQLCSSDADCPSGQRCQATCCDAPRCFEVCNGQQRVRSGRRYASLPR
jgi:hypothetical protein